MRVVKNVIRDRPYTFFRQFLCCLEFPSVKNLNKLKLDKRFNIFFKLEFPILFSKTFQKTGETCLWRSYDNFFMENFGFYGTLRQKNMISNISELNLQKKYFLLIPTEYENKTKNWFELKNFFSKTFFLENMFSNIYELKLKKNSRKNFIVTFISPVDQLRNIGVILVKCQKAKFSEKIFSALYKTRKKFQLVDGKVIWTDVTWKNLRGRTFFHLCRLRTNFQ